MSEVRREISNIVGVHRAARTSRMTSWNNSRGSADELLIDDNDIISDHARELDRDDSIARGIIDSLVMNVVGTGLIPRPNLSRQDLGLTEEEADEIERRMERSFERQAKGIDITGKQDFSGIQRLVFRHAMIDGEGVCVLRRKSRRNTKYRLCDFLIDPKRLANPRTVSDEKFLESDIRRGVEVDADGAAVAYWVAATKKGKIDYNDMKRIPAYDRQGRPNVLHVFIPTMAGQSRGVSMFAPVIEQFKEMSEYVEAERVAARIAACFAIFIKQESQTFSDEDLESGELKKNIYDEYLEELEPGLVQYLNEGEEPVSFNPQRPGVTFDMFIERQLRSVAAAFGLPYELVAKDFSKVNYSSARASMLEARRWFKVLQNEIAHQFVSKHWAVMMEEAFLQGELGDIDFYDRKDLWCEHIITPPGWQWVDPVKEVNAAEKAIELGVSTLADEAAAVGRNYETNLIQLARERRKRRAHGVVNEQREADVDAQLSEIGLKLSLSDTYTRYGRKQPAGDDDVLRKEIA